MLVKGLYEKGPFLLIGAKMDLENTAKTRGVEGLGMRVIGHGYKPKV